MDGHSMTIASGALALIGYLAIFERRISRIEGKLEVVLKQIERLLDAISSAKV